jgi:hypothetical protein
MAADILRLTPIFYGLSSSVRYFGASASAFAMKAAWAAASSLGGGVVRLMTGTPTAEKNSSSPAGDPMHNSRAGSAVLF